MIPCSLLCVAFTVAAPPPKPVANPGRISLWLGDKYEHFKPDGGDVAQIVVPAQLSYGARVTPDRKAYVAIDRSLKQAVVPAGGETFGRLVVTPFDGTGKAVTIEGCFANGMTGTIHGTRVYFTGGKGDEVAAGHVKAPGAFVLDLESKQVTPIPLPDKHQLFAAAPDGKSFITTRTETGNNTYSRKTYYISDGRKPVEILKENVSSTMLTFSPDSSKLLALTTEYTEVKPAPNGAQFIGPKPREFRLLDPATNAATPLRFSFSDSSDYLSGWDWSPDGTRIALCTYDRTTGTVETVPLPGGGLMRQMQYTYKVSVADADGGNAKEIYRTKGSGVKTFMWK